MNTRNLVIKIPKPYENGVCKTTCPLFYGCNLTRRVFGQCDMPFPSSGCPYDMPFPGPGCPWYKSEEPKDKVNENPFDLIGCGECANCDDCAGCVAYSKYVKKD